MKGMKVDEDVLDKMNVREWPGYVGAFTRDQAAGAIPNGRCVSKATMGEGDTHKVGDTGTVLGSLYVPEISPHVFYFIEWDDMPKMAVGVLGDKIKAAT